MTFVLFVLLNLLNAEVLVMKSGKVIFGKFYKNEDGSATVTTSDDKEMTIEINEINKIYINEEDFFADNESGEIKNIENDKNVLYENEFSKENYKFYRNFGVSFIVIGSVLSVSTFIFGTAPLIIQAFRIPDIYDIGFILPLTIYLGLIGIGLIFDIIAIPCLIIAGKEYKKMKDKMKVSLNIGFNNNNPFLAIDYRF